MIEDLCRGARLSESATRAGLPVTAHSASGAIALSVDICIVGAGAAGVSIAHDLLGGGYKVCLVESGGFDEEPETQALYGGECIGHPIDPTVGRYRQFGGSTNRWTGRCAWLDPIDFEARPWVPHSGWPIKLQDLAPFYGRAERLCGFDRPWTPGEAIDDRMSVKPRALLTENVDLFVWRYAPQGREEYVNWGKAYRQALQDSTDSIVVLHSNVVSFAAEGNDDRKHVRSITVASLGGQTATITARAFVLCCGGIENARLLLQSAEMVEGGLGNEFDQVGRYFMQHPRGRTADLRPDKATAYELQDTFNIFPTRSGLLHETGLALPESIQRKERLLNCSGILIYDESETSAWRSLKDLLQAARQRRIPETVGRKLARVVSDPAIVATNILRRIQSSGAPRLALSNASLLVDLEQMPNPESRITLGDRRDALGQRLPVIDWRLSEQERRTAQRFTTLVAEEFRRSGLGELRLQDWLFAAGPIAAEHLAGTYHHIATTRMAADPRDGVVDANCRVHGTENLFVTGSSVFSTGGHANPTLTIVALALRLADHLRTELRA